MYELHKIFNRTTFSKFLVTIACIGGWSGLLALEGCSTQTKKTPEISPKVTQVVVDAVQSIDWKKVDQAVAQSSLEEKVKPYGWGIEYVELNEPTRYVRYVADIRFRPSTCPSTKEWTLTSLGQPKKLSAAMTHTIVEITDPQLIREIIGGETRDFSDLVEAVFSSTRASYPYTFNLLGTHKCASNVRVVPIASSLRSP